MNTEIKRFLSLKVNKKNLESLKFIVPGILAYIIINKELYSKNSDLKSFTKNYLNEDYKDYLFKSRTTLFARVVKDIIREKEDDISLKKISNIQNFLFERTVQNSKQNTRNTKIPKSQDILKNWSEIIYDNKDSDD